MNDIYDIRGNELVSFFSENYFLFISIVIILGVIIYVIYLNKEKFARKEEIEIIKLEKNPFLKKIKNLKIDDGDFYEILSFVVRLYICRRGIIKDAPNKTNKEIINYFNKNKNYFYNVLKIKDETFQVFEEFLEKISRYQFGGVSVGDDEKMKLKISAREIINKF